MLLILEKLLVTDVFIFVIPTIYISTITVLYTLYLQLCLLTNSARSSLFVLKLPKTLYPFIFGILKRFMLHI